MEDINRKKVFIIFIFFSLVLVITHLISEKVFYDLNIKNQIIKEAPAIVENKLNIFKKFISEAKNDILSIRNSISLNDNLEQKDGLTNIENLFLTLAESNSAFMQIRFLDKDGNEMVKVARDTFNGEVKLIAKSDLQNKASRYYFTKSKKLDKEQILFSSLDLNIENGQVEIPFKATIRVFMPILKDDDFKGVLIINYFAKELLDEIVNTPLFNVILTDELGFIIKHFDSSKDWGFYKKEKYNIKDEFPEIFNDILLNDSFVSDNFYSKTLDLGLNDYLYLILETNDNFIQKQEYDELRKNVIQSIYYFILSILFSFLIIKLFSKLFMNLDKQVEINSRLENASEVSKIGFWEYQSKTELFYWNNSIYKIFNIESEDLKNVSGEFLPFISIEERNRFEKLFFESIKNQSDFSYISELEAKDGNLIYVEYKGKHFFAKSGKHIHSLGSITDVTEKIINEKLQKQLLKQTKEFKKLFSRYDDNVIASATNTKGIITYASKAFCEISGFTEDELIGSPQNIVRHPETPKDVFQNLWETIKNGKIWHGEIKNRTKNGGFYWVYAIIYPEFDDENKIIGFSAIRHDLTSKKEFEIILEETKSSIKYASFIQGSLIPKEEELKAIYEDAFILWEPKDIVGGDIILFKELNENESLLMVIDCTGHGVPGAFVSMLVKAIEKQITAQLINERMNDISPSSILSTFNKTFRKMLKHNVSNTHIDIGFDGTVFYYNKKESYVKFSSANSSLIFSSKEELKIIKGDRLSIGYKNSDINHEFSESKIDVEKGMKFYIYSDGYIDQIGGEKGYSLSKSKFVKIIESSLNKSMTEQKEDLKKSLADYQNGYRRVDDVTVVGFEI